MRCQKYIFVIRVVSVSVLQWYCLQVDGYNQENESVRSSSGRGPALAKRTEAVRHCDRYGSSVFCAGHSVMLCQFGHLLRNFKGHLQKSASLKNSAVSRLYWVVCPYKWNLQIGLSRPNRLKVMPNKSLQHSTNLELIN
jgi:hypothetical protein